MPDSTLFRSAFAGHEPGTQADMRGNVGLRVSARRCAGAYLLSTWISGTPAFEQALLACFGTAPSRSGTVAQTAHGLLMRTGPEELLLVAPDDTERLAALRQNITAEVGAVADLSHARCRIRLEGAACTTVLNKLFALNLKESEFPVGEVRMCGTHHVPSLLHRTGAQAFDWYVFTTYAHDQLSTLLDAALEYGYTLTEAD